MCEHEHSIPTIRKISNGNEIVFLQCQLCGGGRPAKKSDYEAQVLPPYNPTIKELYQQAEKEKWEAKRAQFLYEQENRVGEWWTRYNNYLRGGNWTRVRAVVLRRDPMCQVCFSNHSNQVHHLSYESYNKHGITFPVECVGVCSTCHEQLSEVCHE